VASQQAEMQKSLMRQFREAALGDGGAATPTLEQMRGSDSMMAAMATEPTGVRFDEIDAGGVPAMWVTPEGAPADRAILYLHGGGYVIGSMHSHARMVGHIAKAAGVRALNVDYRLAPEFPHPAAVEDAVKAYRWLLDQGIASERIVISGDSAGGGLTVATLLAIRDQKIPRPAAGVPMSPWIDLEGTGDSMIGNAHLDLVVSSAGLKTMSDMFLNGQSPRDPLAAPLYADYVGVAPLYIQVGDEETLLDDAGRLAERATAAGVEVRIDVFPEMQHVFQMSAGNLPEADEAIARIGECIG
jgi:monoterpene epsilon-lactone hydrolase